MELVGQGLSPYYTKYGHSDAFDQAFEAVEAKAREQELGIWKGTASTRNQ